MKFQEGQSGNPAGRPKGAKNKASDEVKAMVERMITGNAGALEKTFKALKGKAKIKALTDLLPYVIPKQQSVSASIDFENFTDEQLDEIINRLIKKSHAE